MMKNFNDSNDFKVLREKKVWIFDMDGVIYKGNEMIPGADEIIQLLREHHKTVLFLTNNSTRTREQYVSKLKAFGIRASKDEIFTSAWITVNWLEKHVRENGGSAREMNVYVVGEEGIKHEIKRAGFRLLDDDQFNDDINSFSKVDFVVAGLDTHLDYRKLFIAQNCILQGASFIVTNDDANLPVEGGFLAPGSGAIVAAISTGSGVLPQHGSPFGKPNRHVFNPILEKTGLLKNDLVMIGDRLETDILAAKNAKISSILVLTGVTGSVADIKDDLKPDHAVKSIKNIKEIILA
ncbi:MAG: HAD-IIA family hydrolase [Promethearchaeota archaeon]